jgi:hypothetical protein
MKILI